MGSANPRLKIFVNNCAGSSNLSLPIKQQVQISRILFWAVAAEIGEIRTMLHSIALRVFFTQDNI
jgi:hypothetical protein